jgi:4-amino-4-deoxy-L-arabinose transferase-like glycosyltransferase
MKRFQQYIPLLSVFLLALLIRLVYNLAVAGQYFAQDDAAWYNHIAYDIVYQHCFCQYLNQSYPSISRPSLWPYMLSIFYFLTPRPSLQVLDSGTQVFYGRLLCCFIGSCTCVLVYLLARDLFGKRIGLLTGYLAAVYAGLFIYDGWLYTETLYIFLQTAFLYSLYRLQRTKRRRWIILSGLSLGLATLARPNGPVLLGMLALWAIAIVLVKGSPWQTMVKRAMAIVCIAAVLIAPWTYRNYLVSHSFVLVSVGEGDVLLGSYNDNVAKGTTGLWTSPRYIRPRPNLPPVVLEGHDAIGYTPQDDQIATDYALHWMMTHLSEMPRLLGEHLLTMWTPFTAENGLPFRVFSDRLPSQIVWFMIQYIPIPIFLLALFGLIVTWRSRKQQFIVVYISIALTIAENIVFYGNMRFRAPIEPLLVLLTGGFVWWLTRNEPGTLRHWRQLKRANKSAAYANTFIRPLI